MRSLPKTFGVLLVVLAVLPGCDLARYNAWLLFGEGAHVTVPAEFEGLKGKRVAVVVFADERTRYENYLAPLTLSMEVARELEQRVDGAKAVNPQRILRYQRENIDWDAADKTELGRLFDADYVLFIALVEYSTRELGSVNLYRGRITAEASLWDTDLPEREARVWRESAVGVLFPEKDPVGQLGYSDRQIRAVTERLFAEKLIRKFHKHKERRE